MEEEIRYNCGCAVVHDGYYWESTRAIISSCQEYINAEWDNFENIAESPSCWRLMTGKQKDEAENRA